MGVRGGGDRRGAERLLALTRVEPRRGPNTGGHDGPHAGLGSRRVRPTPVSYPSREAFTPPGTHRIPSSAAPDEDHFPVVLVVGHEVGGVRLVDQGLAVAADRGRG